MELLFSSWRHPNRKHSNEDDRLYTTQKNVKQSLRSPPPRLADAPPPNNFRNFFTRAKAPPRLMRLPTFLTKSSSTLFSSSSASTASDTNHFYSTSTAAPISPLRQLLDVINMSIVPHDLRLSAIVQASDVFNHTDRTKHDFELHEGAAQIMFQKLAFVLTLQQTQSYWLTDTTLELQRGLTNKKSMESSDLDYEIALLCSILEMIHRASPDAIAQTWNDVGHEALPILLKTMERPFTNIRQTLERAQRLHQSATATERQLAIAANRDCKLSVQKITKVLAIYSLVPEAKAAICSYKGMLPVLVKITDTRNINRYKGNRRPRLRKQLNNNEAKNLNHIQEETEQQKIAPEGDASIATTATTASIHSNKNTGSNGIQGSVSGVGLYMTESARFNVIATLTNLAAAKENRMKLLAEPGLVDNIARVVHNERSDVARQCCALAIMNLSNGDDEHVPDLAGNNLLLDTLIVLLQTNDNVPETRRNAAIALFNVACADQNTVKLVRYKDGAVLKVIRQMLETDTATIGNDVQMNAAEALFNISCSSIAETTDRVANHPGLLDSLASTLKHTSSSAEDVQTYCAATLRRMAEIIHAPKRSHTVLLTAMVQAASTTNNHSASCDIAQGFVSQASISCNRQVMVQHFGLLNVIAKLAVVTPNKQHLESDRIQTAAITTIELLALDESNLTTLSNHEGIMMALTKASYGMSATAGVVTLVTGGSSSDPPSVTPNKTMVGDQVESRKDFTLSRKSTLSGGRTSSRSGGGEEGKSQVVGGQQRRIQDTLKKLVSAM